MNADNGFSDEQSRPRRIIVVDDHQLMRLGVAHLICSRAEWELCGEAEECLEAIQLVRDVRPDLAIVDLRLAKGDGLDLIRRLCVTVPCCRVLVFSAMEEELFAERVLRVGAQGFINKQEPLPSLIAAIEKVLEGRIALRPRMTDRILAARSGGPVGTKSSLEFLSDREMDVFERLGRGMTAKEIASELHLSIKTIEYHRQNIKGKLQLSGSNAVVRLATAYVLGRTDGLQVTAN